MGGEGVRVGQKSQKISDVTYGWPPTIRKSVNFKSILQDNLIKDKLLNFGRVIQVHMYSADACSMWSLSSSAADMSSGDLTRKIDFWNVLLVT